MILSHHGIPDYGSPIRPMTLEALLLHTIDMLDANVYDFENEYRKLEYGQISEPIFSLDKRRIYKSKYNQ